MWKVYIQLTIGRRKSNQQELAAAIVSALGDTGILDALKQSNRATLTSRVSQMYAASPGSSIDGRLTWADLITAGGFVTISSLTGAIMGFSDAAAHQWQFDGFLFFWGNSTKIACGLALVRLGADMLSLGKLLDYVKSAWLSRQEKKISPEKKEIKRLIKYAGPELISDLPDVSPPKSTVIPLEYKGKSYEMTQHELTSFLRHSCRRQNWTRDFWNKRGLSQPMWYALRTKLEPLGVWQADSPTVERFVSQL